jgi:hypothetical protein
MLILMNYGWNDTATCRLVQFTAQQIHVILFCAFKGNVPEGKRNIIMKMLTL